jgi:hypothetical protein
MNTLDSQQKSPTGGPAGEVTRADLIDRIDLSARERLVFSIGLHVASVVLGVGAWLDRHLPAQGFVPLIEDGPSRKTAYRLRLIESADDESDLDEEDGSPQAVEASRRVGCSERPPRDDRSDAVSSERYQRSA